jgi:hypothetical protein
VIPGFARWLSNSYCLTYCLHDIETTAASKDELNFNAAHAPKAPALEAFGVVLPKIKAEIVKSRKHWDQHEPRMWARTAVSPKHIFTFGFQLSICLSICHLNSDRIGIR